jgi:hypothetical protein
LVVSNRPTDAALWLQAEVEAFARHQAVQSASAPTQSAR